MSTMKQVATFPAHASGYGDIHLIHSSSTVVTSGEDGILRISAGKSGNKIQEIHLDDMVSAFVITPDESFILTVSVNNNTIYRYSYPDCKLEGHVYRATVTIQHLAISSKYLVVVGDDPVTRVLNLEDPESPEIKLKGHDATVRSASLSHDNAFVATASTTDQKVLIFALPSGEKVCSIDAIDEDMRFNEDMCLRTAWDPTGKYLAIAGRKEIELREFGTWTLVDRLQSTKNGHTQPVNVVAWSPNGLYLASSCIGRELRIWDVERRECIDQYVFDYCIAGIEWTTAENALAVLHTGGSFAFIQPIIPLGMTTPNGMPRVAETNQESATGSRFVMDEADEDQDLPAAGTSVAEIKNKYGFGENGETLVGESMDDSVNGDELTAEELRPAVLRKTTRQPPFQPGSTSEDNINIMAWTVIGEIQSIAGEERNLVKIEFADRSRRTVKFHDQYLFTVAALADQGAVFASEIRDDMYDTQIPSVVFYRAFDAWGDNITWSVELPNEEEALVVAAGDGWAAAATNLNFVRIYNAAGGGLKCIVTIPGPVVTMTGFSNYIAIAYHSPSGEKTYDDSQNLEYALYSIDAVQVVMMFQGGLPLMTGSTLTWMGFDDNGMLFTSDSSGVVQALHISMKGVWSPAVVKRHVKAIANSSECARLWIVGIFRKQLLYFAIPPGQHGPSLRGKQRPIPSTLSLITCGKGAGESTVAWPIKEDRHQKYLELYERKRRQNARNMDSMASEPDRATVSAGLDKNILQLVKAACNNQNPEQAFDLARALSLEKSFAIAIRIASHFGFTQLEKQLNEELETRFNEMIFDETAMEDDHYDPAPLQSRPQSTTPKYMKPKPNIYAPPPSTNDESDPEDDDNTLPPSQFTMPPATQKENEPASSNPFANPKGANPPKRKSIPKILDSMKSPIKMQRR